MKIIYFGTPVFAADIFSYLVKNNVEIAAVVTKPDRFKGRSGIPVPSPLKVAALNYNPNIPLYQPELASSSEFSDILKKHDADLFVVVAYGEIVKQHLLDMPKLGCVNVHASLLPKYRGAAPIQRCIMNGESESGVTIMHMVKKMDAGDIIKKVRIPIDENMTAGELEHELCLLGQKAVLEVIQDYEKGTVHSCPQNPEEATFAPKVELEDCEVHWERSAKTLHDLIRGSTPHPGAWCFVMIRGERKRLKLIKTRVVEDKSGQPGSILSDEEGLLVACGNGALRLLELQLEGKKQMTAKEFAQGYKPEFV